MKKYSQKILRILAITSMLAIFTQATLVSASSSVGVNTNATVIAGALSVTAGSTAALKVGSLSSSACTGSSDPDVSSSVQTLCTNISSIVVTDLRSYSAGWAASTQLKHLTYVNQIVKKLTSGTVTNVTGVSPFDVDTGTYTGDRAHPSNKNLTYRFTITTAGGRAGSNPAGSYNLTRPDGSVSGVTAIPGDGDVVDAGLTFNFAAFAHVVGDVYYVQVDAIHMFDRDAASGLPGITATTKFQPGTITAASGSTLLGGDGSACVTAGNANNDVEEHSSDIISESLTIITAEGGCGKGRFTIAVGVETLLYANSTAGSFTAAIVITVV